MKLNDTLSGGQIDVLSTVYLVFLTPSVIGSFSVVVVSIIKWRHLREQVQILVQLAMADLLAALILMSTSAMNKVSNGYSVVICQYSLPLSLSQCRREIVAIPVYTIVWLIPIAVYLAYVLTHFITTTELMTNADRLLILVLTLLSALMKWTNVDQSSLFGLYVIQAVNMSLQGFLNSMVYAWRRPNFTEAVLGETIPLLAYDRLAFFEESLRVPS
eukprot:superscaffoldBa00000144_g2088